MLNLLTKSLSIAFSNLTKFRRHIFKPYYKADVPCICIGNLQVGGTGKTPTVLDLGKFLLEKGIRPFIVLRGYKGKAIGPVKVDRLDPIFFGDEALIYFRNGLDTIVSKDRLEGIKLALNLGAHIILCDDGFQDLRIDYDKKILCFKPFKKEKDYSVFPEGILRESLENSKFADYLLITKYNLYDGNIVEKTINVLQKYNSNIYLVPIRIKEIVNFYGEKLNFKDFENKNIYLISGIGNCESFEKLITKELQLKVSKYFNFKDHYYYTLKDINNIYEQAKEKSLFLTTEKDFVRLHSILKSINHPIKDNIIVVRTYLDIPKKLKGDILNLLKNLEKSSEEIINFNSETELKNETYRDCRPYKCR